MPANCDDELSEFDASASDTSVLLSANRSVNRPITLNAAASGVLPSFDIAIMQDQRSTHLWEYGG